MKKANLIFYLILGLLCCSGDMGAEPLSYEKTSQPISFLRIHFEEHNKNNLDSILKLGLDVTYFNGREGYFDVFADPRQRKVLEQYGFLITELQNDMVQFLNRLNEDHYFELFHTYDEMLSEMEQVVMDHPGLASLHDIGDSYGKGYYSDGYEIWALKISDEVAVDDITEADALFMANIHAREIITPEVILYFMHYLIDHYGYDAYVTHLINNREIWLVPMINPDGHEQVFTGKVSGGGELDLDNPILWRKNLRDNNLNGSIDIWDDGVDLNRNFGYKWGYDNIGSSPHTYNATYRGPESFSEPESQSIKAFVETRNFVTSLSYHSYGELWLYPWGYTSLNPPEPDGSSFKTLADSCVAYNGYEAGNVHTGTIYLVNGDTDDWLYGEHGIFAFTPEVTGPDEGMFWPDNMRIEEYCRENLGPNLYMAYAAGEEPLVQHERISNFNESEISYDITAWITPPILLTEPVGLDATRFFCFYQHGDSARFDSVKLVYQNGHYGASIPGDIGEGMFYYYIQAVDSSGRIGSSPRGAPMAVDSFRVGPDLKPPVMFHDPYPYQSILTIQDTPIRVRVTDDTEVSEVKLEIRKNGGNEVVMDMVMSLDSQYEAYLDTLNVQPGDFVEYRIIAVDGSENSNVRTLPEEGWLGFGIYQSFLFFDFETDSVCVPDSSGEWEWGSPVIGPRAAFSGKKSWGTQLVYDYDNKALESKLFTPEVHLSKDFQGAAFQFFHWYLMNTQYGSPYEGGNVKILVDEEEEKVIHPKDGYLGLFSLYSPFMWHEYGFSGPLDADPQWKFEFFDLTEYIGHTIRLCFHYGRPFWSGSGWYIDDMAFLGFLSDTTGVVSGITEIPEKFMLFQNFPNPFNCETTIQYTLSQDAHVHIVIYNGYGQVVSQLVDAPLSAGFHSLTWDGLNRDGISAASGVYLCQIEVGGKRVVKKMVLIR